MTPREHVAAARASWRGLSAPERAASRDRAVTEACDRADALLKSAPREAVPWARAAVALVEAKGPVPPADLEWRARRGLAKAHHAAGDAAEALAVLAELGSRRLPARRRADVESTRAVLLARVDRPAEASRAAARARALFRGLKDRVGMAHVDIHEANALHRREEHDGARTLYRRALRALERAGRREDAAAALVGLGNADTFLGRLAEAEDAYRRAEDIFAAAGRTHSRLVAAYNRHYVALMDGRAQAALDGLADVARGFRAFGDARGEAHCHLDRAEALAHLRCWPEALEESRRARTACLSLGLRAEAARAALILARAEVRLGSEARVAGAHLDAAAQEFAALDNAVGAELANALQAELRIHGGRPEEAVALARKAASAFERRRQPARAASARVTEAEALARCGAARAARRSASRAAGLRGAGDWALVAAETLLSELALAADEVAVARAHAARATARLGRLSADLAADRMRLSLAGDLERAPRAAVAAELAGSRPRIDRAFAFAEEARRFGLLDGAIARRVDGLAEWARGMRSPEASRATKRPARPPAGLRRAPAPAAPRGARLSPAGAPFPLLGLSDVQRRLAPGDLLVQWTAWPDAEQVPARVILVGREQARAETIPWSPLSERVLALHDAAERVALARVLAPAALPAARACLREALQVLAAEILSPLDASLASAERLLLVPAGGLASIPWPALPFRGARLGEQVDIAVLPAASWLARPERRTTSARLRALSLGSSDAAAPGVDGEVEAVAAAWGRRGRGLSGVRATRAAWAAQAPASDIVHLGGHGSFREDAPELSSLRLADGWQRAEEFEALPLRARVVSLSACQAGSSRGSGAQSLGLVRCLLRAGARRVVASPWPMPDALAADLWPRVHEELARGLGAAAALRAAMPARGDDADADLAASLTLHGRP